MLSCECLIRNRRPICAECGSKAKSVTRSWCTTARVSTTDDGGTARGASGCKDHYRNGSVNPPIPGLANVTGRASPVAAGPHQNAPVRSGDKALVQRQARQSADVFRQHRYERHKRQTHVDVAFFKHPAPLLGANVSYSSGSSGLPEPGMRGPRKKTVFPSGVHCRSANWKQLRKFGGKT